MTHWESDVAPDTEPGRAAFVLSAMKAIASWPNATAEAVCSAAMAADDEWIRGKIMEHSKVDNWTLSARNSLLKALGIHSTDGV